MNQILSQPTRKDKIRGWLAEHRLTYRQLGRALGLSDAGVRKSLLSRDITPERHREFLRLGLPPYLLPEVPGADRSAGRTGSSDESESADAGGLAGTLI